MWACRTDAAPGRTGYLSVKSTTVAPAALVCTEVMRSLAEAGFVDR